MKKQELIHLHGLLAEVTKRYTANEDRPLSLDEYETHGVRPTSIHKSKTDHKSAVFALAKCITSEMETEQKETVAPQAD